MTEYKRYAMLNKMNKGIKFMDNPGFVYIWHDTKRARFYIGSHIGLPDDGYICSSYKMMCAYKSRPSTFKRRILEFYTNVSQEFIISRENMWLSLISSNELGKKYYNYKNVAAGGDIYNNLSTEKQFYFCAMSSSTVRNLLKANSSMSLLDAWAIAIGRQINKKSNAMKPGEAWIGKSHSAKSKLLMSVTRKGRTSNRKGSSQTDVAKHLIAINNPNRRTIHTPYGEFISAERFEKETKKISACALRPLLAQADVKLSKQRCLRSPLFTISDLGKTPRELGWYYVN
jgi:hypothetical protein